MRAGILAAVLACPFWLTSPDRVDANGDEVKQAGENLRACYLAVSAVYGLSKCDPTSTLVGAVFGKCSPDEEALRHASEEMPQVPLVDMRELAQAVLDRVRRQMTPQIQSWILDAQMQNPKCK